MVTVIYIFTENGNSTRIDKLCSLFTSESFKVKIIDQQRTPKKDESLDVSERLDEIYKFDYALRDCEDNHPDSNLFILKDSSVTHINSRDLEDIFRKIPEMGKFHLCYFCKWLDRCDLYTNKKELGNRTSIIAKTQAPHGVQALLITKECRDILLRKTPLKNKKNFEVKKNAALSNALTECILKGHLTAICVVPNVFDFDLNMATRANDYYKSFECLPPPTVGISQKDQGANKFASYVVLIILLLLIVIGFFLLIMRK